MSLAVASLAAALCVSAADHQRPWAAGTARYYFRLGEVRASPEVTAEQKALVADALRAELDSRSTWVSDLGVPAGDEAALVGALKKRGVRGFDVTLRVEELKQEVKDPSTGGRTKRLAVHARVSLFGTVIPGAKLAFSGEGEAGIEAEASEQRMAAESAAALGDAIKSSVKQAVDQAESKLSVVPAAPLNEKKRRKK
jgi:opacity protein-like surface antigen